MKLDEILGKKGRDVVTIDEASTVLDAARLLVERNIGSLVVLDGSTLRGIITERDVLRLAARSPDRLATSTVGDAMTRDVVTATPGDDLRDTMDVMTERRIRHLPVVRDERLAGIISIGDLVNACRISAETENTHLRQYIQSAG